MTTDDDKISAAIADALADALAGVGMVEGWVAMVAYTTVDGERRWSIGAPDEQLHDRTISLLDHALAYQTEVRRLGFVGMLREMDDDD